MKVGNANFWTDFRRGFIEALASPFYWVIGGSLGVLFGLWMAG